MRKVHIAPVHRRLVRRNVEGTCWRELKAAAHPRLHASLRQVRVESVEPWHSQWLNDFPCSKESRHKAIGVHSKFADLKKAVSQKHHLCKNLQILPQTKTHLIYHVKMKTTNQIIITHLHNLPPFFSFSKHHQAVLSRFNSQNMRNVCCSSPFPPTSHAMTRARRKKALRQAQPFKARTAPRTLQRGNASERPDVGGMVAYYVKVLLLLPWKL